jgi:hypothetical protein
MPPTVPREFAWLDPGIVDGAAGSSPQAARAIAKLQRAEILIRCDMTTSLRKSATSLQAWRSLDLYLQRGQERGGRPALVDRNIGGICHRELDVSVKKGLECPYDML